MPRLTYTYIRLRDKEAVIDGIPVIDKLSIKDALTALRSRGVSLGAPTASARYGWKKHKVFLDSW